MYVCVYIYIYPIDIILSNKPVVVDALLKCTEPNILTNVYYHSYRSTY